MRGWLYVVGGAPLVALLTSCDGPTTPPAPLECESGQLATVVQLQPGGSHLALNGDAAQCIELRNANGRYILSVLNTNTAAAAAVSFQLHGQGPPASASVTASPSIGELLHPPPGAPLPVSEPFRMELRHRRHHGGMLARNIEFLRTMPRTGRRPGTAAERMTPLVRANAVSTVIGEISSVHFGDLDSEATLCSELPFDTIQVRTVYVGPRAVVVEDVASPRAGQMDGVFAMVGAEFDQQMWPILTQNFGNPLALDAELGGGGRVVMVFSPRVNQLERGVAGYVLSCDFLPRTVAEASNEGQFFYAMVPTATGNIEDWRWVMRSTIIHEVKHITSFAERFSRNAPVEDVWLEEATAMLAEELWARNEIYNRPWKGNILYGQSIYCEIRSGHPSFPECAGYPLVMASHFLLLYQYMRNVERLSPLGDPPGETGSTFYGSGWSFVRWAIDHYATTEAAFLLPLTRGPLTGIDNIVARTGRPWPEMLADWSLANAVDDRPNFTPQRSQHHHPSWSYRNVFSGLRLDLPSLFSVSYPLTPRQRPLGSFTETVNELSGGTAAYFELTGTLTGSQLLELQGADGGPPPAALRAAIVRVQ